MNNTAVDKKYGTVTVEKLPGTEFHEGEPVFLLRGQDKKAPAAIDDYADECEIAGAPEAHCEAVRQAAHEMRQWQKANPDLVKTPD